MTSVQAMDTTEDLTVVLKQIVTLTLTEMNNQNLKNKDFLDILKKVEDHNEDDRFLMAVAGHLQFITSIQQRTDGREPFKFLSTEEFTDYQISAFFLKKYKFFETTGSTDFQTDYAEEIPNIPLEYFIKLDENAISKLHRSFTKCDILYGEVINSDENHIKLRIICKIDLTNFIYPFNIHTVMFKEPELSRLGLSDIPVSTILKVVILGSCSKNEETIIYTTTNESVIRQKQDNIEFSLGIVPPNELPFNLKLYDQVSARFSSYAQYLRCQSIFHQSKHVKEAITATGIDINQINTFAEDSMSVSAYNWKDKMDLQLQLESKKHADLANKYAAKKEYDKALKSFKLALECWPRNYKVFEKRGIMYASMSNKYIKKAITDLENCLSLNPSAYEAKMEYSKILTLLAKIARNDKSLDDAKKYLSFALQLNEENKVAKKLMGKVERAIQRKPISSTESRDQEKRKKTQIKSER